MPLEKKVIKSRTEDEKVAKAGIEVTLGGKEYLINPLVIVESRPWRAKVGPWQAKLSKYAAVKSDDNPEEFADVLTELMVDRIDQTIDYFFEYAKELDRGIIESVASDREVVKAFQVIFEYAFPFD